MRQRKWWWTAAMIVVPVVAGTTIAVALLLVFVDVGTARDRIELLKTGLTIGAGAGGMAALVLAGRRQWSVERANADTRYDAAERRITDLYSKAADQLGSDKAAVRLAGLYSLERLAQDTPTFRQTIVNLLCAYLRMASTGEPEQELEVRRTALRILCIHLRPGEDLAQPVTTFWADIDLDLTGAVLHFFDLKATRVRHGAFGAAKFVGGRFDGARFDGDTIFGGAQFAEPVSFRSVHFGGEARFRGASFAGLASFDGASFHGEALFGGTRGSEPDGASFAGGAIFTGAHFSRPPVFEHVHAESPIVGLPDLVQWGPGQQRR